MFNGTYNHTIDSKNRIFIPAALREELGDSFKVCLSLNKCLEIYTIDEYKNFIQKLEKLPMVQGEKIRTYFFANTYDGNTDEQGRVIINKEQRQQANLEKEVVIVGQNTHLQVWNKTAWEEYNNDMSIEKMREILAEYGI